jgi:hypothetical protein
MRKTYGRVTIEITGQAQDQMAQELREQLSNSQGQVQVFTETERTLDPITGDSSH